MTAEVLLMGVVVGLIAGWLASTMVGGGLGLVGDLVVGTVGSFIGGILFRGLGGEAPFGGFAGAIFVATVGAVVLLGGLRLLRRARWV